MARGNATISDSEANRMVPANIRAHSLDNALSGLYRQLGPVAHEEGVGKPLLDYVRSMGYGLDGVTDEARQVHEVLQKSVLAPMNRRARRVRDKWYEAGDFEDEAANPELSKSSGVDTDALMKAQLDVGSLTDFSQVTGGQTLGYFSLDTRMARSTVRPNAFTLYQALEKSLAWQIVDFWPTATDTGAPPPGAAYTSFSGVATGSLATSAGSYAMNEITLKLAVNGRAITTALAAQNNYVNISEQETTNAALTVLESTNYALYWGNSTLYTNQFNGLAQTIPAANIYDFQGYSTAYATANSWSPVEVLFNMIYEVAADVTSFATYGHITHAFMSPLAMGSLQGLSTTLLNNIVNTLTNEQRIRPELTVNGNLVGINTRVGNIAFPQDLYIDARKKPAASFAGKTGAGWGTASNPTPPTSVTATVSGATVTGSQFTTAYAGTYVYAVASTDAAGNESALTYSAPVSGIVANGGVYLAIAPNGTTAINFRVYRSGLGYNLTTGQTPGQFRLIGEIAANAASTVTFQDINTIIPGSTEIFLLDMDPLDFAIDYRMLLPLVRVELFAQNLFMPWAVAMISALRLRIPKWHAMIRNVVPQNPEWNPLSNNIAGNL